MKKTLVYEFKMFVESYLFDYCISAVCNSILIFSAELKTLKYNPVLW